MPKFQHRRTGRLVEAKPAQVDAYLSDHGRWQLLDPDSLPDLADADYDPAGEVPDGSVAEILAWAGDDPARKEAALYAERQGKGRKTLLDRLS